MFCEVEIEIEYVEFFMFYCELLNFINVDLMEDDNVGDKCF